MKILKEFEKGLEYKVDGFFAGIFKAHLQPVELAKALQRYAGTYFQNTENGTVMPNVYRYTLSPVDLERFKPFVTNLHKSLCKVARRTADDSGLVTVGPIKIEFECSKEISDGVFEIRAKVERPAEMRAASQQIKQGEFPVQTVFNPPALLLRAVQGNDSGKSWTLTGDSLIGRLPECQVVLSGTSVSRRHAQILHTADGWVVKDLGSTNGIKVNSQVLPSWQLRAGDKLEVGGITIICDAGSLG